MALRSGHGNGAGVPRIEVMPADELPAASDGQTVGPQRGADGRFLPGNAVAKNARLRLGKLGNKGLDKADPEVKVFLRWGRNYSSHRRTELAAAHGGSISAAVGALVESAGQQLGASRYLQAKASETGDAELFKRASSLANDARQNELAAWELAAREAKVRVAAQLDKPIDYGSDG